MRRRTLKKDIIFPERNILNLLRDYSSGKLDNTSFLYKAIVVKIDQTGGQLEKDPKNPKNSIQARIIENSYHSMLNDVDLPVFWPLFPFDILPVKEGEHVYVIYENEKKDHGIWITRIPEPFETDKKNLTLGINKYKLNQTSNTTEQQVQDLETPAVTINVSSDFSIESVPPFSARVGDRVIEGSNNATIVLGRDRPSDAKSGQKQSAGTVDIVVGRSKSEDMDMQNDKARIYITMNSDVDDNFQITDGTNAKGASAVVLKADEIRIVASKDFKIVVDGQILLGKNATEAAVLGNTLVNLLRGPIGTSADAGLTVTAHPTFLANLNTILSTAVKIKG